MGRVYGYVRISSRDQNEARQMAAMREAGVSDRDIYLDKRSGADFERQGYRQLLRRLRAGDTLIVKSIDRLGRNYDEILEQWRIITREKCASILVLDMPLLDTRQNRDLTGTLIADIVLQLLSYVAQTEREFIRQRQGGGDRGGEGAGCPLRATGAACAGNFSRDRDGVARSAVKLPRSWKKARRFADDFPQMAQAVGTNEWNRTHML